MVTGPVPWGPVRGLPLDLARVVYGATCSTQRIEEDAGLPVFAIVRVHDGVRGWPLRRLGEPWPTVQIVASCDHRLMTEPADTRLEPCSGAVTVVAPISSAGEKRHALGAWSLAGVDRAHLDSDEDGDGR